MSTGLSATRHLFGGHCAEGAHRAAEVTRTEADLRTVARKLARQPERRARQNELLDMRTTRDDARRRATEHAEQCQACADRKAELEGAAS
jgi:hypothetical protein